MSSAGDAQQQQKRKKKKKSKSKSNSAQESTSDSTAHAGDGAAPDPSQLPLAQRLELAAAIPDVHAALIGLLGWSRLYVRTDTTLAFFQCDALELLLANVLRARPTADAVYDNLAALLANCLTVDSKAEAGATETTALTLDPSRQVADTIVNAVRAVVRSLKSGDKRRGEAQDDADDGQDDAQDAPSVDKAAATYLSRMVISYSMSLRGVDAGSERSHKEMLALESKIAANAQRGRAVQGLGIRDNFERRDIRSDALSLLERRLDVVSQLVADKLASSPAGGDTDANGSGSADPDDTTSTGFRRFLISTGAVSKEEVNDLHDDTEAESGDDSEMQQVTQRLQDLHARKNAELAGALAKKQEADGALQALKKQREALEAQLRAVAAQIEDALAHQERVDDEVAAIERKYELESDAFDAQHQHVIRAYERRQRRQEIAAHVDQAAAAVREISLARSGVEPLQHKQANCRTQHLEAVLNYFSSELPCVKFMMARAVQTQEELRKLDSEAEGYRALGVPSVAKELALKAETLQTHLNEDRLTLTALRTRDFEIIDGVDKRLASMSKDEVNDKLVTDVQRHAEYVKKLYADCSALSDGDSVGRKPGAAASTSIGAAKTAKANAA